MNEPSEPEFDECARCGQIGEGQRRWMFYNIGIEHEFFCQPCLGIMRIYAWIGFSLLFVLVSALIGAVVWLLR